MLKLFLAATSLLPEYGGPAYSVSRLAMALSDAGIQVGLWSADQSVAATSLLNVDSGVQCLIGTEHEALERFGRPDIIHDNGIWLPHNHRLAVVASRRRIPRIVSTHGMLHPWAMRHKRSKKSIAWWLYQRRDLRRASYLHATSCVEADRLRSLGFGIPVCVIPNAVDVPTVHNPDQNMGTMFGRGAGEGKRRVALFLGRIHPVKGLPMLVEAWKRVKPEGWLLQIAGPDKDEYRARIEKVVTALGLSEDIFFVGPLEGKRKISAFANASLFVLPTHSENFGIVIAEALSYGLPVLTTTAAPWSVLAERDCGWSVDPTVEGIVNGLRKATQLDIATLRAMGAKGRELVAEEFGVKNMTNKFINTYELIAAGRRYSSQY